MKGRLARGGTTVRARKNPPARAIGLLFVLIGLIMLAVLGQQTELRCARLETNRVDCSRTSRWMGLLAVGEKALGNVTGAWVDRRCDEDGCTYAVRFDTDRGEVGLVSYYSSGQKAKQRTADEVNAFLRDAARPSLLIRRGPDALGIAAALTFGLAGGVVFAGAWQKGKPLSRARQQALANSFDTFLGPVAWQADADGLEISFHDEGVRMLWQDITRAAMVETGSPNLPGAETLGKIPGLGKTLNMAREIGVEYRALVLARGKARARAFRCLLPIMEPAAAVLVDDVRRNVGDRWLGELTLADQNRLFDV